VLRPSILPGEYALGYQGRFAQFNGWRAKSRLNQALLDFSGNSGGTFLDVSRVETLSVVAGLSVEDFVAGHTTIPVRRAFVSDDLILPHGNVQHRKLLSMSALRHINLRAYFCRVCANEDYARYGFSYWRRVHQVVGIFHCPTHDLPLSYVRGIKSFEGSPLSCVKMSGTISFDWVSNILKCAPVSRYTKICMGLLSQKSPQKISCISGKLSAKAKLHGIVQGQGRVSGIYFSDCVVDILNIMWLERLVPGASTKSRGISFLPIDGVLLSNKINAAYQAYILAFAVLYPTVEVALQEIISCDR
jgi:hypothetical protein